MLRGEGAPFLHPLLLPIEDARLQALHPPSAFLFVGAMQHDVHRRLRDAEAVQQPSRLLVGRLQRRDLGDVAHRKDDVALRRVPALRLADVHPPLLVVHPHPALAPFVAPKVSPTAMPFLHPALERHVEDVRVIVGDLDHGAQGGPPTEARHRARGPSRIRTAPCSLCCCGPVLENCSASASCLGIRFHSTTDALVSGRARVMKGPSSQESQLRRPKSKIGGMKSNSCEMRGRGALSARPHFLALSGWTVCCRRSCRGRGPQPRRFGRTDVGGD